MSELEPFGHKNAWLAVRDRGQTEVIEALGLPPGEVVGVREALAEASGTGTAVLPPLPGVGGRWTLVVGDEVSQFSERRLAIVSALLGTEVQAFASHRVAEAHRWMVAEEGTVLRHLDVVGERGELIGWTGRPTRVELDLGLPDVETMDGASEGAAFDVVLGVHEDHVMRVAGSWSVDPSTLDGPAPGSAILVGRVRSVPPTPDTDPQLPVVRPVGFWRGLFGKG